MNQFCAGSCGGAPGAAPTAGPTATPEAQAQPAAEAGGEQKAAPEKLGIATRAELKKHVEAYKEPPKKEEPPPKAPEFDENGDPAFVPSAPFDRQPIEMSRYAPLHPPVTHLSHPVTHLSHPVTPPLYRRYLLDPSVTHPAGNRLRWTALSLRRWSRGIR